MACCGGLDLTFGFACLFGGGLKVQGFRVGFRV